jgi:hypothetical protein
LTSHFLNLVLFSAIVSTFFAFLTRNAPRERWRIGLALGISMVGLSLALAWIMYPFPGR